MDNQSKTDLKYWLERGCKIESEHDKIQVLSALEFIDKINLNKIKTIADIGSGPGHHSFIFHQLGINVTCVDYVKPLYDLDWCSPLNLEINKFDAIWSHHCLEHVKNPIDILTSWRKALVENGVLFLTVPEIGLTISTGHLFNFNMPILMYLLTVSGFDCSGKLFVKSRSHLRAVVTKAKNYAPENEGHITSLTTLAERGLFPPSVASSINKTGRYSAKDIHLHWFGKDYFPNAKSESAYEFIIENLWKYVEK